MFPSGSALPTMLFFDPELHHSSEHARYTAYGVRIIAGLASLAVVSSEHFHNDYKVGVGFSFSSFCFFSRWLASSAFLLVSTAVRAQHRRLHHRCHRYHAELVRRDSLPLPRQFHRGRHVQDNGAALLCAQRRYLLPVPCDRAGPTRHSPLRGV